MSSTPNDHLLQTDLTQQADYRTEILFILDNLPNVQTLAAATPAGSTLVLLDGSGNALQQMADYLAALPPASVDAIHLLSHGSEGSLQLGSLTLTADNLNESANVLRQIGSALTEDGDLLFYGCNVAEGDAGVNFIGRLAQITGADIAASNNITGMEGDWLLETITGTIDFQSRYFPDYANNLATATFDFSNASGTGTVAQTVSGITVSSTTNTNSLAVWNGQLFDYSNGGNYLTFNFSTPIDISSLQVGFWSNSGSVGPFTITGNGSTSYTYSPTFGYNDFYNTLKTISFSDANDWGPITTLTISDGGSGTVAFQADNIVFEVPPPNITISDASITEGNSGTTTLSFTVSLSSPAPTGGVTFDIATANNTALAGSDYAAKSLTGQTIAAGNSSYTFEVTINGDTDIESNETFFVNLTNVIGATVADGQGLGTITNDDVNSEPTLSLDNTTHSYTENTSAIQIDASGTVSDVNGDADWNGGKLDVQITSGAIASDEISIADTDGDGTTITVSGTNIFAGGVDVGDLSVSGGAVSGGTKLTITFDSDATNAIVQETLQSLRYRNTGDDPGNTNRVVTVTATDNNAASASDTRTIAITAINDDPAVAGLPASITVTEDISSNADLSTVTFADVDSAAGNVSLTIAAGTGTLAATSGGSVTIGGSGTGTITLTGTAANIDTFLNTASNIKYTGAANASGNNADTLTLTANDGGNTGTGGGGDVNLGTVQVNITAVNDAPVLDNSGAMTLTSVTEDDANPAGDTVADIIASAGGDRITDVDGGGAVEGIAITGLTGDGTWQYNTGAGWTAVGAVSASSARLLTSTNSLRFVPTPSHNNAQTATLTFRAWDQTSGSAGSTADVTTNGGTTAFSTTTETAAIIVTAVNDTPTISAGSSTAFTEQTATAIAPAITVSDPDGDTDWSGGTLTVQITANASADDSLRLPTSEPDSGIWINGIGGAPYALYSKNGGVSTQIGTANASTVSNTTEWAFTFNANATNALVQEVARSIQFGNDSDDPATANRTITFTVADASSASASASQTVTVTPLNDAPEVANRVDPALTFSGEATSYAEFADNDASVTDQMTLEVWVKFSDLEGVQFIAGKAVEQMELHTNANALRFIPTGGVYVDTGAVLVVDQWTHIAASYDANTDVSEIYSNGVKVASVDNNAAADEALKSTADNYRLGIRGDNTYPLNGAIAEYRIWNSIRTADEIRDYMNVSLQGNEANLVALWKLDEAGGTTLADSTAYNFDGTAYNGGWISRPVSGGLAVSYSEGAAPVAVFSDTSVTTVESGQHIKALTLTVSNLSDSIEYLHIDGSSVALTHGTSGTTAGSIGYSVSVADSTATISLTHAGLTEEQTAALINGISYSNSSQTPTTANPRVVSLTAMQDDGGTAGGGSDSAVLSLASTVALVDVNDPPALTATGQNPTFVEGSASSDLFSAVSASTVESGQNFTSLTLTVINVSDGADEILTFDGSDVALTDGNSVVTASNGLSVNVSVTGSTATASFSGATLTAAQLQTLVDGLAYRNTSDNPTTGGNRVVTITQLTDSGANSGDNDNTAALALASTVSLTAVNDAPVVDALYGETSQVIAGAGAQDVTGLNDATVSNPDSADYNGGFLTITQGSGTINGSWGVDGTTATAGGDGTLAAGETITVGGVAIGTAHATNDGQGGNSLQIDFNADATSVRIQTLLQALTYSAPSSLGTRTFTLTLNDGDGTANAGDQDSSGSFQISVTPNPPVIANLNGDSVSATNGNAVAVDQDGNATATDADSVNFNGGNLTISRTTALSGNFSLTGSDTIGVSSGTSTPAADGTITGSEIIFVDGVAIASVSAVNDGQGTNDLRLNFGSNATPARVQAVIRALQFASTSEGAHSFNLTVTDASSNPATSTAANFTVDVAPPNTPPVITSNGGDATAAVNVSENTTAVTTVTATDADPGDSLTYSISGGADQAKFSIDAATGVLTFAGAPNFENPTDVDTNNSYEVIVTATDNGDGNLSDTQALTITVTDVNENPVIITNGGGETTTVNVAENSRYVTTVRATDADADNVLYSLTGGADQDKFTINIKTGVLQFIDAPDFETATDSGSNNSYEVQVTASDGNGGSDVQILTATVTDVDESGAYWINRTPVTPGSGYPGTTHQEVRNDLSFAALKSDGTVVTWGYPSSGGDSSAVAEDLTGVQQIYSTQFAFAALKGDGTVVTWGSSDNGGNSSAVAEDLTGVQQIYSTHSAFAALKNDGTVVTWGGSSYGGDSSAVAADLTAVQQIYSTQFAFAALKSDGTVVTWGHSDDGGDSSAVAEDLTNVQQIYSTQFAFAALKSDGTLVTWGDSATGGDSNAVAGSLTGVQQVYSNSYAFAALKSDGTVVTWGHSDDGGDSSAVAADLTGVQQIYSTQSAFAALKSDGTVVTWGYSAVGGDSSAVAANLTGVQQIYSNGYAFAALKSEGTVVTWGYSANGGNSSAVAADLTGVQQVYSTQRAFAALKSDGTVVTWGGGAGGDSSAVAGSLTGVQQVYSNSYAFAALKSDGTVVTWGDSDFGGDSSSVAENLTGVVGLADIYTDDNFSPNHPPVITSNNGDDLVFISIS
ncbi:DUF4347 domain-containing protein, partial [Desulfuromonas thiophila]|uniref:DUF4347 domain-containing protein n=1 Tax=Desulfuromonas thiophila TaxID=57664 RepID=UPI0024A8042A